MPDDADTDTTQPFGVWVGLTPSDNRLQRFATLEEARACAQEQADLRHCGWWIYSDGKRVEDVRPQHDEGPR